MHLELQTDYQNHVARNRRKRFLKKAVSIMGCLVVFCTTYALILPAITMENKAYCGMEEHTHTEACYTQTSANVLVCSADDYVVHTHEAGCFGENGVVLCGQADIWSTAMIRSAMTQTVCWCAHCLSVRPMYMERTAMSPGKPSPLWPMSTVKAAMFPSRER